MKKGPKHNNTKANILRKIIHRVSRMFWRMQRWCFEKAKYPNSGSQTLDVADKVHVQNLGPMDYSRQSVGQSGCAVVLLVEVLDYKLTVAKCLLPIAARSRCIMSIDGYFGWNSTDRSCYSTRPTWLVVHRTKEC